MAQIAPPARFTLSEWIDHDDGDTSPSSVPACTNKERMLHAHVVATVQNAQTGAECILPPPGFALPPLG